MREDGARPLASHPGPLCPESAREGAHLDAVDLAAELLDGRGEEVVEGVAHEDDDPVDLGCRPVGRAREIGSKKKREGKSTI